MPPAHRERLDRTLAAIAAGQTPPNADVKPLKGRPGRMRLRIGEWRAIYRIDSDTLSVITVAPRGSAYD